MKKNKIIQMIYRRGKELFTYRYFLFKKPTVPINKFLVFAQGRTGSDLLRSLLNSNPMIFCDGEILEEKVFFPMAYIKAKCASSRKNTYGFKLKIYQLTGNQHILQPEKFVSNLYNQNWKIIYLNRRNLLRQVVSGYVAQKRKSFHHRQGDSKIKFEKIHINYDVLINDLQERECFLMQEKEVLKHVPHITINYEDHLMHYDNQQNTLNRVFDFLNVPSVSVKTNLVKITSSNLSNVILNYNEVKHVIAKTKYVNCFDD
ncbi:MAG: hypothetical protein ACUZ8I_11750 [Candidatus Scalindua sp.]